MSYRKRVHKPHEPIYGSMARHAKQDTSMLLSDMPNTRFKRNLEKAFKDPKYMAMLEEKAKRDIMKAGAMRRAGLKEVSYKCSGRTGYGDADRL